MPADIKGIGYFVHCEPEVVVHEGVPRVEVVQQPVGTGHLDLLWHSPVPPRMGLVDVPADQEEVREPLGALLPLDTQRDGRLVPVIVPEGYCESVD